MSNEPTKRPNAERLSTIHRIIHSERPIGWLTAIELFAEIDALRGERERLLEENRVFREQKIENFPQSVEEHAAYLGLAVLKARLAEAEALIERLLVVCPDQATEVKRDGDAFLAAGEKGEERDDG